jgi:membrane protein implicated in regulation of membrane protease activity
MDSMDYFWLFLLIGLVVVEAMSVNLISIWFAIGALCALIASALFGAPVWLEWTIFIVVSGTTLAGIRPFCKRFLIKKDIATNADRNIGEIAVCTEPIDNVAGTGAVRLSGIVWTARTANGTTVDAGQNVRVDEIKGSKLMVTAVDK